MKVTTGLRSTKADHVLAEIEEAAKHSYLPIIGPAKGRVLAQTIKDANPQRVLEIGTLIGYSAILIGKRLGKNAKITTIEIHPEEAKIAQDNIKEAAIAPKITIKVGDAIRIIPTLKGCYDAVFIDADKTEYYEYLQLMENRLHAGSIIVADNAGIFANQMQDYLDYVRKSGKYRSRFIQVGEDGLEISVKL